MGYIKTFLILLIISPVCYCSNLTKCVVNFRNATSTPKFDYYLKIKNGYTFDSVQVINIMYNIERQEAKMYYSYSAEYSNTYFNSKYYKDTEKSINYTSISIFYPFHNVKLGYSFMKNYNNYYNSIELRYEQKYISCIIDFFNKINKVDISFTPEVKVDKVLIGYDIDIVYVHVCKWNAGLSLTYKF
jgi:hypothetical protein